MLSGLCADLKGLSTVALNLLLLCVKWQFSALPPVIALIPTCASYWRNILPNALTSALSLFLWLSGVKVSHKPIKFNATSEELLRHEINELAFEIQSLNDKRDALIGKIVALETKGMDYCEQKAYSLAIRWYGCKDFGIFKRAYREAVGSSGDLDPSNTWGVHSPASNWGKPPTYKQMMEATGTTDTATAVLGEATNPQAGRW